MGNIINFKMNKIKPQTNISKPDDILTIKLPKSNLALTRYLYICNDVYHALLLSILNKSDDAIFWAYELYYSGYYKGLFDFIWKIYYDFFATLNPSFEQYLIKKQTQYYSTSNSSRDIIVSTIIQDLLIRDFNTDIFTIRILCSTFNVEYDRDAKLKIDKQIRLWIENNSYRDLSIFIMQLTNNDKILEYFTLIYDIIIKHINPNNIDKTLNKETFILQFNKIIIVNQVHAKIILLSRVLYLFLKKNGFKEGKLFYMSVTDSDIINYKTIDYKECKPRDTLKSNFFLSIQNIQLLNLFKLTRNNYTDFELFNMLTYRWLYNASFSPIWFNRIKKYGGYIDYSRLDVKFISDAHFENFYEKYNYEPDEQPNEIQNRIIGKNELKSSWQDFYEKFKNNGLISLDDEELYELNIEPVIY